MHGEGPEKGTTGQPPEWARPRILNVHVHGRPPGSVFIGRGSAWGNPFVIGRDGDRDAVCDRHERWIEGQAHLMARLGDLRGRDLVCFCAPRRCHGETLRRLAEAVPGPETP